jgi:hypothetical protein
MLANKHKQCHACCGPLDLGARLHCLAHLGQAQKVQLRILALETRFGHDKAIVYGQRRHRALKLGLLVNLHGLCVQRE